MFLITSVSCYPTIHEISCQKCFLPLFFKGIFVTRVQPEGPASKLLQPGDKIIQVL